MVLYIQYNGFILMDFTVYFMQDLRRVVVTQCLELCFCQSENKRIISLQNGAVVGYKKTKYKADVKLRPYCTENGMKHLSMQLFID